MPQSQTDQILKLPAVMEIAKMSRSTIWRRVDAKSFPQPVRLGDSSSRSIGWRESDVIRWITELKGIDADDANRAA